MSIRYLSGVNIDSGVLVVDSANDRVGIGTASPSVELVIYESSTPRIHLQNSTSGVLSNDGFQIALSGANGYLWNWENGATLFGTNNAERMRITAAGNVGIGTTSPVVKLQVDGTITSTGVLTAYTSVPSINIGHNGDSAFIAATSGGGADTPISFSVGNNNEKMRITAAGNVGIGTTAPQAPLHVIAASNTNDALIQEWSYTSGTIDVYSLMLKQTVTSGVVRYNFSMVNASTAYNDVLVLDRGNVGIGTTSPSYLLDVNGSGRIGSGIGTGVYVGNTSHAVWTRTGGTNGNMALYSGGSDRITIVGDTGNVGIGTTSPSQKLQVAGSVALNTVTDGTSRYYTYPDANHSWYYDNNIVGSSADVMTYYENFLVRHQDTTNVFLINGSGNVGIGTTSPSDKLSLAGSTATTFGLSLEPSGWNNAKHRLTVPVSGDSSVWSFNYNGSAVDSSLYGTSSMSIQQGTILFSTGVANTAPSEKMRITSAGNVGIGTTSPVSKLNINNGDAWINVTDTLRGLQFGFAGPSHGSYRAAVMGGAESYGGTDSGMLTFHTQNGYVVSAIPPERMRISSSGNVGIGTTVPSRLLTVSNPANGDVALFTNTVDADLLVNLTSGVTLLTPSTGTLAFGTSLTERMRITSAGNVGIGTTAPGAKLQINNGTGSDEFLRLSLAYDTSRSARGGINWHDTTNTTGRIYTEYDGSMVSMVFGSLYNSGYNSNNLMIIRGNGNVGIGTTSPSQALHVSGSARVTGAYYDSSNSAGSSGQVLSSTGSGTDWVSLSEIAGVDGTGTANYVSKWSDANTLTDSVIYDNGTNVGIGTTAPASRLHVADTGEAVITVQDLDGTNQFLTIGHNGGSSYFLSRDNTSNGDFNWYAFNGTTVTSRMRITSAGNVGIGTNAPQLVGAAWTTLEVQGQSTGGGGLVYTANNGASVKSHFYSDGNGGYIGTQTNNYFAFTSNNIERMRITAAGNVGIGTTAPSTRFQVNKGSSGNVASFTTETNTAGAYAGITLNSTTQGADDWYGSEIRNINVNGNPNFLNPRLAFFVQNTNTYLPADRGEKMTINGDGNVGIGTTNPAQKLHVAGNGLYTGNLDVGHGVSTGDAAINLGTGRTGNGFAYIDLIGDATYTDYGLRILRNNGGANTSSLIIHRGTGDFSIQNNEAANLTFVTAASERMRITSAGNVGIGTTSPSYKLDVNGATQIQNELILSTNDAAFRLYRTTGVNYFDWSSGQDLRFSTVTSIGGAGRSTAVTFLSTGNVGIGTTDAGAARLVLNSGTANQNALINGDKISFTRTSDAAEVVYFKKDISLGTEGTANIHGYNGIQFITQGAETVKAVITAAGSVGIGTTAPYDKLEVNGAITATGSAAGDSGQGHSTTLAVHSGVSYLYAVDWGAEFKPLSIQGKSISLETGTGSTSARVTIDNSGNVGIGTTSPATKLVVESGGFAVQGASSWPTSGFGLEFWNAGTTSYIGAFNRTTSVYRDMYLFANDTIFENGGSQRMRITAAGNVGIGTTSPAYKLDVDGGPIRITNGFSEPTSEAGYRLKFADNGGINNDSGIGLSGSLGDESLWINKGSANGNIRFMFGTLGEKVTFTSGGNVGIGTTSPTQILSISRVSTDNYIKVEAGGQAANYSGLMLTEYGINWGWTLRKNAATDLLHISYQDNTPTFSDVVTFDRNGNVGIGTTAPGSKLHVWNGGVQVTGFPSSGSPFTFLQSDYNDAAVTVRFLNINPSNGLDADLGIQLSNTSNVITDVMRIKGSTGNVGIGTTSPGYKLEVYGSVMLGGTDAENYIIRLGKQANSVYMGGPNTNTINVGYDENQVYNLHLNYLGYQASTTQYRNLIVNDGRQGEIARFVGSSAFVGIGNSAPSYKLDVTGDVRITSGSLGVGVAPNATDGRIDASNDIVAFSTSDERFKENITPIANALEKVKTLTGVEFDWRKETKDYHGYVGHDVGVIAQQVKAVLPEAVRTNANGYLAVRYEKIIGLLIEANKELAARVEELESKLK